MNKVLVIGIVIVALAVGAVLLLLPANREGDIVLSQISSFEDCAAAGNTVMESYPRQCRTPDGQLFIENISDPLILNGNGSTPACDLAPEIGLCEAAITKYFFDKEKGCTSFLWGGCGGVVPFQELSECVDSCETGSGVIGQVLYGPFCPVVKLGDPTCDDRPYPTMVDVYRTQDLEKLISTVSTDNNARFLVRVEPGTYVLQPKGGTPFPRCGEKTVVVGQDQFGTVTLLCDTGIR